MPHGSAGITAERLLTIRSHDDRLREIEQLSEPKERTVRWVSGSELACADSIKAIIR
jgi:hypothetical protein